MVFIVATGNILLAQDNLFMPQLKSYYSPPNRNSEGQIIRKSIKPLYSSFYLGMALPSGNFASTPSANLALLDPFYDKDGMGAKTGGLIGFHFKFPLTLNFDRRNKPYFNLGFGGSYAFNSVKQWEENGFDALSGFNLESKGMSSGFVDINAGIAYNLSDLLVFEFNGYLHFPLFLRTASLDYTNGIPDRSIFTIEPGTSINSNIGRSIEFLIRNNRIGIGVSLFEYHVESEYQFNFNQSSSDFVSDFYWTTTRINLHLCI